MPHEPGHEEEEIVRNPSSSGGDEPKTKEEVFAAAEFNWQESIIAAVQRDLREVADDLGYNRALIDGVISQYALQTVNHLEETLNGWDIPGPRTTLHYDMLLRTAKVFLNSKSGLLQGMDTLKNNKGPGTNNTGGGGGGGLSATLTPEQIRQNFDLDQLTEAVSTAYRGTLLDEPRDPRGIARAYVESIVKNPEQKLDFDTFVDAQIKKQPRYNLLYGNKPRGLSDAQFMQPYVQSAMQHLRPGNVADKARAGAQLGSSPDAFRENLNRSREAQVSTPFINKLEQRTTQLGGLFRS